MYKDLKILLCHKEKLTTPMSKETTGRLINMLSNHSDCIIVAF